jgi:UDP-glucose 4-epimerase
MKTVLVVGGAGYIGSHTSLYLVRHGYKVVILDNFLHDQPFVHKWAEVIRGDFSDRDILRHIFSNYSIDSVMHFAACINVGESVLDPLKYYENNVSKTISLLEAMIEFNVRKFIFSSSCAVYGDAGSEFITEDFPLNPISPYGKTKLIIEQVLQDLKHRIRFICLRYFNAAGALPEFGLGEIHKPETHLIPLLLRAAKNVGDGVFTIYGNDYNTKDGTCIRDFLHVWDIASAHYRALRYINEDMPSGYFNLGTGRGTSVIQLINSLENILQQKIKIKIDKKREGDPAILMADPSKAKNLLNWKPEFSDIQLILRSAYAFENDSKIITDISTPTNFQKI